MHHKAREYSKEETESDQIVQSASNTSHEVRHTVTKRNSWADLTKSSSVFFNREALVAQFGEDAVAEVWPADLESPPSDLINQVVEEPKQNEGEIWEIDEPIGECRHGPIDRYTTFYHILGWWGDSFIPDFMKYLKEEQKKMGSDAPVPFYPKGSHELKPNQTVDGFLSYRWETGRGRLHLAFVGHFAMPIIVFVIFIIYPIIMIIMHFTIPYEAMIGLETHVDADGKRYDTFNPAPLAVVSKLVYTNGEVTHIALYYWFRIVGACLFAPILLYGPLLLFWRRYFLDRLCIAQVNHPYMIAGIKRLPLFLMNTIRPRPKIRFVSVAKEQAGAICILGMAICQLTLGIVRYTTPNKGALTEEIMRDNFGNDEAFWILPSQGYYYAFSQILIGQISLDGGNEFNYIFRNVWQFIFGLGFRMIIFYCGRQYFKSLDALSETEKNFDVRNCGLTVENDRQILLDAIHQCFASKPTIAKLLIGRNVMKHDLGSSSDSESEADRLMEEAQDQGLLLFNAFVKMNIRAHIPWRGLRSCVIMNYIPAILTIMTLTTIRFSGSGIFEFFDFMSVPRTWSTYEPWYFVILVYGIFVVCPLSMYFLGCIIRFVWMLERRFKWIGWWGAFIILILFDFIIPVRDWFTANFMSLLFYGVSFHGKWNLQPTPFWMFPNLLVDPTSLGSAWNHKFGWRSVDITLPVWAKVIVWIWLVFTVLFTYYVYEPVDSRHFRSKCWYLLKRTFRRTYRRSKSALRTS